LTSTPLPQATGVTPLLTVAGLTTRFLTPRGVVHALDDVSFTLSPGETLGIVGESGSGKSVIARTIMDLLPTAARREGVVCYRGRDLLDLDRKQARSLWGAEISMVFQDPTAALNPVMRIGRQITETLELHLGLSARAAQQRAIELLTQVGISEPGSRLSMYPHQLSGGMCQRVCIAIAVACNPRLLFADEPTTALDVTIQRQILDLLSTLQQQNNMAMVLITHDFGVVARRSSRVVVLYAGKVAETGPTTAIFREMRHPYTKALLAAIPRLEHKSHTRLAVIPGQPMDVVNPGSGCRFAERCTHAQPRCIEEDPPLTPGSEQGHDFACFYPIGTTAGEDALARNRAAGKTATGLEVSDEMVV
jgi:peptide/nickel transport system ATP-binding protein